MRIKVKQIQYHRNGVAGEGFHVVLFHIPVRRNRTLTHRSMVATVFDQPGQLAVLDVDLTQQGILAYSTEESLNNQWRGDDFEPTLRKAIHVWDHRFDLVGKESS